MDLSRGLGDVYKRQGLMSAKTLVIAKWNNGNRKSKLKMERTRKTSNLCSLKLCS
jgi:hypothetical protein